ncbi:LysR substrate-binding domain-containing protein [Falsiroseomonas sp.]|uniref:LysR substrate-binding domain-containing protein n=1 Tax=Falsiroseomonas sp. TaxID=2870721 RepID=UPI0034A2CC88
MRDTLPPLAALHAFALVAETGSLTAAAARLNVTQPAVSRRLRELEATLGTALLRRGANAVVLTEAGARYAEAVRSALDMLRSATAELGAGAQGPLRVRAYTTWALRWLIPRLPRFRAQHPGIEIELVTSTAPVVDFAREGLDAAIRSAGTAPAPGAAQLQRVTLAAFGSPAALHRAGPGGLTRLGSRVRPRDWGLWDAAGRRPSPAAPPLLFESTSLAIQAALEGLGAVICPPDFVAEDLRSGRLAPLPGRVMETGEAYWLLLPPGRTPPAIAAFRDWLVTEAKAGDAKGPRAAADGETA